MYSALSFLLMTIMCMFLCGRPLPIKGYKVIIALFITSVPLKRKFFSLIFKKKRSSKHTQSVWMYNGWLINLTTIKVKSSSDITPTNMKCEKVPLQHYGNEQFTSTPKRVSDKICRDCVYFRWIIYNKCGMLRDFIVEYKIHRKMIRPWGHKT